MAVTHRELTEEEIDRQDQKLMQLDDALDEGDPDGSSVSLDFEVTGEPMMVTGEPMRDLGTDPEETGVRGLDTSD